MQSLQTNKKLAILKEPSSNSPSPSILNLQAHALTTLPPPLQTILSLPEEAQAVSPKPATQLSSHQAAPS